jgi:hypothetical protein
VQEEGGPQYDAWGERIEEGEIGLMGDDLYTEEMPDGIEGKAGGAGGGRLACMLAFSVELHASWCGQGGMMQGHCSL